MDKTISEKNYDKEQKKYLKFGWETKLLDNSSILKGGK